MKKRTFKPQRNPSTRCKKRPGSVLEFGLCWPQDGALVRQKHALSSGQIFRACMHRELLLVDCNRPLYVFRFVQLLLLALVTATLFLRTRMQPTSVVDGNLYFGGDDGRLAEKPGVSALR